MVRVPPALAALLTAAVILGGCEPAAPPASAVAPVAAQALPTGGVPNGRSGADSGALKTAAEYLAEPPFAAANLARGELLSFACAACHTFGAGERVILGPNLHGVFGRSAAALAQFNYSPALRASGIVWTPQALEAWLAEPARFVEGTTMAFSGYRSAEDRRDLIAYLLQATQ